MYVSPWTSFNPSSHFLQLRAALARVRSTWLNSDQVYTHRYSPRKTLAGGAAHKPSMYPPRIGLGYLSMHNALSIAALSTQSVLGMPRYPPREINFASFRVRLISATRRDTTRQDEGRRPTIHRTFFVKLRPGGPHKRRPVIRGGHLSQLRRSLITIIDADHNFGAITEMQDAILFPGYK